MPLFNTKTIANALGAHPRQPTAAEIAHAADWAARADHGFGGMNESQLEQEFNKVIVQGVLGYTAPQPGQPGTMMVKQPIGAGAVDVALGQFGTGPAQILAPFELKGPKTGLDAIMPGRAKTPVQQAWDYANDAIGAKWVLVSNMREIRLYAIGHGRAAYEAFEVRKLTDPHELRRLQLLLHADHLLAGATADLLARSAGADRDVTDALYRDYRTLRDELLQFTADQRPHILAEARIALVQKLLDRLVFIAFAEDTVLLPTKSIAAAVNFNDPYNPRPKWNSICALFNAVDKGNTGLGIPAYNGGLFATDTDLDGLDLPDHLVEKFLGLAGYDFQSEVSVTILGHLFEQSISDIEALLAEARGEPPPTTGKRKRDGVVYTPAFVTAFIVERTIGVHLAEIRTELLGPTPVAADGSIGWPTPATEADYWRAYLARMAALKIVDPACGSGAFLIAAFDLLDAEQRRVRARLADLEPGLLTFADANADIEIVTRSLYGVDVNQESVEITKLALWIKTAKKGRQLESLDHTIRCGNSIIEDSDFHNRAFVWAAAFPEVFADGGFDIVIGNPPYVRMELLKAQKPYLEKRYAVVSDRADLYAYFFELGVRLLRTGGRLGYISSSTFFRTGSGAPLRAYLGAHTAVEAVVDFGDLQIFEGVTTYPAIITLQRSDTVAGDLRFLNVKALPEDLSVSFDAEAQAMPRARLTDGSWRFESDALDAIRAKMATGRQSLAEVYGAPLYGIKTGLNEAFVLTRVQRDALVATDPRSADLLKPFLIGENLKRWHVESDDLWLIYTPKNRIDIDDYPAVRDHLLPFKERLEKRATQQNWWELQQAQAAYLPNFQSPKILYNRFTNRPQFTFVETEIYTNDAPYLIPSVDSYLAAYLNSKVAWFFLSTAATSLQNGYVQLLGRYVEPVPIPAVDSSVREMMVGFANECQTAASALAQLIDAIHHRLADITPTAATIAAFRKWPDLDFAGLRALLKKRCKAEIALADRAEWENWFNARRAEAAALRARITAAEAAINARVYALFDLTPAEIAAIEAALAGQY